MQSRAEATREAVLLGAAKVFAQHGYAAATVSQILSEAGVTKGAAYFHFDSKDAMARAIIAEQSNWRAGYEDGTTEPFQRVINISLRFFDALVSDPLVQASIRLTLEQGTFERTDGPNPYEGWLGAIAEMLEESSARKELIVEPDLAAHLIISLVTGTQLVSEALTGRSDLKVRAVNMWSVLAPSLVTRRTLKQLTIDGQPVLG